MIRSSTCCWPLFFLATCLAAQPKEAPETKSKEATPKEIYTAFVGGRVYPVSRPPIDGGTVLVKGGKIVQVGRGVRLPEGTVEIDARGKHVLPGFVAVAATGVLGVSGTAGTEEAADQINPFSTAWELALSAGITTVHEGAGGGLSRTLPGGSGGPFGGSPEGTLGGVLGKLTYGVIEGFTVREPAAVYLSLGNSGSDRVRLREALEKARRYQDTYAEWIEKLVALEKSATRPDAPAGDNKTKALARCLRGELPLVVTADDREDIRACVDIARDYKVSVVLDGGMEAWTLATEIGRAPMSVLLASRSQNRRDTRPHRTPGLESPHGWSLENAAILTRVGVPWATRTMSTSMSLNGTAGRDLLWLPIEAAFAVRGGVSDEEALRSLTLSAAEILKVDGRLGSLDEGKDADILVMDREPLDYRALVDLVYVNGRSVYERSRSHLWSHLQTNRSEPPKAWAPWGIWGSLPTRPGPTPSEGGSR